MPAAHGQASARDSRCSPISLLAARSVGGVRPTARISFARRTSGQSPAAAARQDAATTTPSNGPAAYRSQHRDQRSSVGASDARPRTTAASRPHEWL